jgi:hypothetical protein
VRRRLWTEAGDVESDRIVVCEVMVDNVDEGWWRLYRRMLEDSFDQKETVVRSTEIRGL